MSFASSISSIFGGSPAPTQQQAQPGQPGNLPANAGATAPGNTTIPPETANKTAEPPAPLADFATLWERDPNAAAPPPSLSATDPKKLMEAAQKTDFSKSISKEVMAQIQAGGQGAVEATLQAMNSMTQTVYANSAMATAKMVDHALTKQMETFQQMLPGIIKKHAVSDTLRSENPIFANPAIQPLISALESQLAVKHPQATASELTGMAKQYIEGVGLAFSPPKALTKEEKASAGETDWSKFLD